MIQGTMGIQMNLMRKTQIHQARPAAQMTMMNVVGTRIVEAVNRAEMANAIILPIQALMAAVFNTELLMPRSLRPQLANTWQLVWNKGLPQTPIFRESADYRCFLKILAEMTDVYRVNIHAYALLPAACHVVLHTERPNLSKAMRYLFGSYSQYINRTYKRQGPVFRGRFYSLVFDPHETLFDIVKSVHLKPVHEEVTTDLNNYEWCSHRWYVNPYQAPIWLKLNALLSEFSKTQSVAVKRYNKFIWGESATTVTGLNGQRGQGGQIAHERKNVSPTTVMNFVLQAYNTTNWALENSRPGRKNMPRLVTLYCLRHLLGLSHDEIAKITGARDANNVGQALFRARQAVKNDDKALGIVQEIRQMRQGGNDGENLF